MQVNQESENKIMEKMIIERYNEINEIKNNLTHHNYFYRVFKKHYKQKYMHNIFDFPFELKKYIMKIDKCLFNKIFDIKSIKYEEILRNNIKI
jgi:hypothetical protein